MEVRMSSEVDSWYTHGPGSPGWHMNPQPPPHASAACTWRLQEWTGPSLWTQPHVPRSVKPPSPGLNRDILSFSPKGLEGSQFLPQGRAVSSHPRHCLRLIL